jgi:aminoglycoside phosphotransferase family enzyme/predicted kinase
MALSDSVQLVENLVRAGDFPHPTGDVEVVETHISWVLLTGAFAYKIKKPVDLGFLDFSTLDQRRHFCAEELRLNRRYAKEIYLDVVDIGGRIEAPVMDSKEGEVLDVAVRMVQFPSDALLSRQLADGKVSADDMVAFGITLARLHDEAPIAEADSEYGSRAAVFGPVEANFRVLQARCAGMPFLPHLEDIHHLVLSESRALEPILASRRNDGRVRECHGDLHLANVVRLSDRITPFDCLEFDPELRWIDVINEVAFLFMDTLKFERTDLAYAFLNGYVAESGDYAGLELLPFFVSYRALVRAKVRALGGLKTPAHEAELQSYLGLADEWSARSGQSILILTHGLSGSGKTAISEKLMASLPAIRLRSDVERKRLFGLRAHDRSDSGVDTGLYDASAGEKTYARLAELAGIGLAAGFNVIVDAAFLDGSQRERFAALADSCGSDSVVLVCDAPATVLRERVVGREQSGHDASEASLAVLDSQLERYRPLARGEDARAVRLDTRVHWSGEAVAKLIRQRLASDSGISE